MMIGVSGKRGRARLRAAVVVLAGLCLSGMPCRAQPEVGSVAGAVGAIEVQRKGEPAWQPVFVGAPILLADTIRSGADAAVKVVFRDDSVVDLAAETQLTVERFAAEGERTRQRSLLRLGKGTVRVLRGDLGGAGGRYEIETPTAIVNAGAPAFVVHYDAQAEYTDVVGVEGNVDVLGRIGVIESGVQVGPHQLTRVAKGRLPAPAEAIMPERFAAYQQGLVIVGTGQRESLDVGHRVVAGRLLRSDDRPGAIERGHGAPESYLRFQESGETLGDRYSRDLGAHAQPIQEFRIEIPGEVPPR